MNTHCDGNGDAAGRPAIPPAALPPQAAGRAPAQPDPAGSGRWARTGSSGGPAAGGTNAGSSALPRGAPVPVWPQVPQCSGCRREFDRKQLLNRKECLFDGRCH